MVGSFAFAIYGVLIHAMPIAFVNGFIVLINIYYLYQYFRTQDDFKIFEITRERYDFLEHFYKIYSNDLKKYYPEFSLEPVPGNNIYLIYRNMTVCNLLILKDSDFSDQTGKPGRTKAGQKEFEIIVDYVIPKYRDFKVGKFLFNDHPEFFLEKGITKLCIKNPTKAMMQYFKKFNFTFMDNGKAYKEILSN